MVKYVKVCPKCGSTNIGKEWGPNTSIEAPRPPSEDEEVPQLDNNQVVKTPEWEYCKDCGHGIRIGETTHEKESYDYYDKEDFSDIFPEVREDKLEDFRKKIRDKSLRKRKSLSWDQDDLPAHRNE
jgi:predicted RNA-binding Zn-ribbon protein involved in translation (DUF1610 family)